MRLNILFVLISLIAFNADLSAQIHRSESGAGGAVILPYWTSVGGGDTQMSFNDSLLSVRNDSDRATVAKLHWLDEQGEVLQSFNLYLDAASVWTGAVTERLLSSGGLGAKFIMNQPEPACVLPSDVLFAPPDAGYQEMPLDGVRGSLEIIEMATVEEPSELATDGRWTDCETLNERFEGGPWQENPIAGLAAPSQMLSASVSIINVGLGGMNTIPATALAGFSDVAQHTVPDSSAPDLSHAFDSAAPSGGVRSMVCHATGCRADEWAEPIKAVAAALMATSLKVDYNIEAGLGAEFEWMIHRPLKRYENSEGEFAIGSAPLVVKRTRSGEARASGLGEGEIYFGYPPYDPLFPDGTIEFPVTGDIVHHVLTVDLVSAPIGTAFESAILGHPGETSWSNNEFFADRQSSSDELESGSVELLFGDHDQPLVAADGAQYLGEPVISFAIQQFTNGALSNDVLANYRGTERPRRHLVVAEPE